MNYISTRGQAPILGFEDTLLAGLASDGGLYVPQNWPKLDAATLSSFAHAPYGDVARLVLSPFIGDGVAAEKLGGLIDEAYANFSVPEVAPLRALEDGHYLLELFHGPTLAFKDIAMQILARLMDDALTLRGRRATIIGATSGDTGGAAIEAFRGLKSVDIFTLFPDGRVSDVQRKQMTTPDDENVHTLAVNGTFDDCQALVKAMFNDAAFRQEIGMAAVNSINWARVMAQSVYYFTAVAQLDVLGALQKGEAKKGVCFCVPTGNFGDIFAGYVAAQMGLPVAKLLIATNVNDILARTMETGTYAMGPVVATQSPSMDIQISSNFERLLFELTGRNPARLCAQMDALQSAGQFDLTSQELEQMRVLFAAERVDEDETLHIMRDIYNRFDFQLDPHSAVGVGAARHYRRRANVPDDMVMVSLATAHAAKFPDVAQKAYGNAPDTPQRVRDMMALPERFVQVDNDVKAVQSLVRKKYRPN